MLIKPNNFRTISLLISSLLFPILPVFSQIPELAWEKKFDVAASHYFTDVLELTNGNFVVLGSIKMPGDRNFDIWILELNNNGDTLKTNVFENAGNDIPFRILQNGQNGYFIASMNTSPGKGSISKFLAVDLDYTKLWEKDFEELSAILETDFTVDNSNQIWWMNTFIATNDKPEIKLTKLDFKGNKTGEFKIEESNPLFGYSIRFLNDGMLGVTCQVQLSKSKPTVLVIKLDLNGKVVWKSVVPPNEKVMTPQCLCCSPDNSMLVGGWAGMCYNPDAPVEEQIWDYDYLLSKLDANGKIIWTQNYNREGSERGTAVVILPGGNIMAAGKCETSFTGTIGPWLLVVDKDGKILIDKVYKFCYENDKVARIICTSDGGFLMVGPGHIESRHQVSGWIKKLNPLL